MCFVETITLFMMAWRIRRGGGLSRGAGDADMLPLARLAFTISATVKGRGSAGWAFAFSVTCVSDEPLACGPAAVLACATMQSSAQHQRLRYRARLPRGFGSLAVVITCHPCGDCRARPPQGRHLEWDLLRLVPCLLDPCRHLCVGKARLLVDGVALCRM